MADTEQVRTTLSTLLNVEFPPDFVTLFYGVRPCHLRPKSWHPVPFDWDALNVALRNGRFPPPRLRLSHSRPETLADLNIHAWLGTRSQVASPSLRRKALHEGLARGATLILDSADEVSEGLRDLALGMSSALRESIGMNCYASVRADENFGAHWDEHDVFAYQMCGRKRWLLFSTADRDETGDFRTIEDKCPAQVSAEIILDRGDVLYIPRGCWHQVIGIGEPSLHVSIGVVRRRAIDLLKSLIGQLDEDPLWGATIPRFGRPERLRDFEGKLRTALLELAQRPLSISDYFERSDQSVRLPLVTNLPWAAPPPQPPAPAGPKNRLAPSLLASNPSQQVESDSRRFGNPPSIQSRQIAL